MYTVCYTGACVHERRQDQNNQENTLHMGRSSVLGHVRTIRFSNGRAKVFLCFFFFPYKIRYLKQRFPLERCFPSSRQLLLCLGFDGCVKLKLIVSLSPLQWSQPRFCPSSLRSPPGPGCLRQRTHRAWWPRRCRLPKQLSCILKRQLPTQQNKTLRPLESTGWMVLCPVMVFAVMVW